MIYDGQHAGETFYENFSWHFRCTGMHLLSIDVFFREIKGVSCARACIQKEAAWGNLYLRAVVGHTEAILVVRQRAYQPTLGIDALRVARPV